MTLDRRATALLAGLLFGFGLALSGMVNPANVISFVDLFGGSWNPRLAGVMGGAVPVAALIFYVARKTKPAQDLPAPPVTRIDKKLVIGAILFGIGWGLAGICPGPSLIAIFFDVRVIPFFVALLVGMVLGTKIRAQY